MRKAARNRAAPRASPSAKSAPAAATSEPAQAAHSADVVSDLAETSPQSFYLFGTTSLLNVPQARRAARIGLVMGIIVSLYLAYWIRMDSVKKYGYLIHEFDPWFNFRATQYMSDHGWDAFFRWFDYMSWYPLGRPVGSTTYPGLQITAVALHRGLNAVGIDISINNVCVLMPAWFGVIATMLAAALGYEASGSLASTFLAAAIFSALPAHLMRSMAGEFDNECIALAAMLLTFYLWVRALRCPKSWPIGALAGLAYGYMVAAWGGYIFVINMVALHAGVCAVNDWVRNRYNPALLRAYALFYVIGTAIATRVPPVGMAPFKSLEQLSALLVLLFLIGLQVAECVRACTRGVEVRSRTNSIIRFGVFAVLGALLIAAVHVLAPTGYFGPLSSRVRALFVAHTRTGNPLVDSVSEHKSVSVFDYLQSLHLYAVPWLFGIVLLACVPFSSEPAMLFAVLFNVTTLYFASRMSRLMVIAGPSVALTTALVFGPIAEWAGRQLFWTASGECLDGAVNRRMMLDVSGDAGAAQHKRDDVAAAPEPASASGTSAGAAAAAAESKTLSGFHARRLLKVYQWVSGADLAVLVFTVGTITSVLVAGVSMWVSMEGRDVFAIPRIVFPAELNNGTQTVITDYYDSYVWLKENTPADARVLAWWDYGYHITGIGNRTSLADGNTWNHEHIATIGKMLTSPVQEAHSLVRHMADYVLVWSDDLGKSPHIARIGNSVYRDICPNDPLCARAWIGRKGPTPLCKASLLFNLVRPDGDLPRGRRGEEEDEDTQETMRAAKAARKALFKPVYTSPFELVRIYKVVNVSEESKAWVADPANRRCDKPGSWICPGQYPPAKEIQDMLSKRIDFSQLEDFNRKGGKDDAYYKAYMAERRH